MRGGALLLSLLALALAAPAQAATAPDFRARTAQGDTVRLSSFRGRVVVVDFWATWCPPCREQLPRLAQLEKEIDGVVVLAVNVDKRIERIERFGQRVTLPRRVLLDPQGDIATRYDVGAMPWTVLIDAAGNVVWARTGLDQDGHAALAAEVRRLLGEGAR